MPRLLYSRQPLNRRLCGPQSRSGRTVKEKKTFAPTVARAPDSYDCIPVAIPITLPLIMTTKYILNTPPQNVCVFEGLFQIPCELIVIFIITL